MDCRNVGLLRLTGTDYSFFLRFHCFTTCCVLYHPQTKFAKVMFLQVCLSVHGGGHAWPGGACVVGGMHGQRRHAW